MNVNADVTESTSNANERVSERVITAVAAAKDVEPWDLDTPLYHVVDPDALNSVFRNTAGNPQSEGRIVFTMAGCEVVVHGDGEVAVTPPGEGTSADDSPTGSAE